jgi:hypothetical protein
MASQLRERRCQRQPVRRCDRASLGQLDDDLVYRYEEAVGATG